MDQSYDEQFGCVGYKNVGMFFGCLSYMGFCEPAMLRFEIPSPLEDKWEGVLQQLPKRTTRVENTINNTVAYGQFPY